MLLLIILPTSIFAYTLVPEISFFIWAVIINIIAIPILILSPFTNKSIPIFIIISLISLQIFSYNNRDILTHITCTSYGRTPISQLNDQADEFMFCGLLVSCEIIELGNDGDDFEVCTIQDTKDTSITAKYVNIRITHSDDALVQISHDLDSLRLKEKGTLVIRNGVINCPPCNMMFASDALREHIQ